MAGHFKLTLTLLLLAIACLAPALAATTAQQRLLEQRYNDGSEMSSAIIRDDLQGEECQRRCASMGDKALSESF
jgi:hypothetical protein